MIGSLPKSLAVGGREYEIRSDFRVALLIFEAFADPELRLDEKARVCVECLYEELPENFEEAYRQAAWFLDGGDIPKSKPLRKKTLDWKQDESMIFSAVNKVAGREIRALDYMHWWTFLGYFSEIGESMLSQVLSIRTKKAKGKKLEKWEKEFYNEHRELIDIRQSYSAEEQAEIDRLNKLLGE